MKKVILGTAGHIDHGKTTLMKALTGVDLDRLKDEKERGITIELGFTSLTLPSGQKIGIIDVPGHERFIKNMVAGVGGIDIVLMVIAADEGVMPQTREHLDICKILRIQHGIIALTKVDLVDGEWIELVKEDIKECTRGTFLEGAPVIPLSSVSGQGISELLSAIDSAVAEVKERPSSGILRLPVDRVFTMKGFGTIITGTLVAGTVSLGDEVEILPGKKVAKVRGIQVHNEKVTSVDAGVRTAINLQGVEKSFITRGDVVTVPNTLIPTARIDAWLEYLPTAPRPLKNRTRVRFHTGTSETLGEVLPLSREEITPGQNDFVQIILEKPVVVLPHDRYVLRSYSPVQTLGGGEILHNLPSRRKRFSEKTTQQLEILKMGDTKQSLRLFCEEAGRKGLDFPKITALLGLETQGQKALIDEMVAQGLLTVFNHDPLQVVLPEYLREITERILEALKHYHREHSFKEGIIKEELKNKLPYDTHPRLFSFAVDTLVKEGKLVLAREFLCLSDHKLVLKQDQKKLQQKILALYRDGAMTPPTLKEVLASLRAEKDEVLNLISLLLREQQLIKVNDELFYEASAFRELKDKLTAYLAANGEINAQGFKELTGLSRKFMIPLLEYFDKAKITIRVGEKRVLRGEAHR